jgi:hypothetical protein
LSKLFHGKYPSTKAKPLVGEILSGRLYNNEVRSIVNNLDRSYTRDLFKPWRFLKARDVSAVDTFKTEPLNH